MSQRQTKSWNSWTKCPRPKTPTSRRSTKVSQICLNSPKSSSRRVYTSSPWIFWLTSKSKISKKSFGLNLPGLDSTARLWSKRTLVRLWTPWRRRSTISKLNNWHFIPNKKWTYSFHNADHLSHEEIVHPKRRVFAPFTLRCLQDCRRRRPLKIHRLLHSRKELFLYPAAHLSRASQVCCHRSDPQQDPAEQSIIRSIQTGLNNQQKICQIHRCFYWVHRPPRSLVWLRCSLQQDRRVQGSYQRRHLLSSIRAENHWRTPLPVLQKNLQSLRNCFSEGNLNFHWTFRRWGRTVDFGLH